MSVLPAGAGLGLLGDPRAVEPLLKAFKDRGGIRSRAEGPDDAIRMAALVRIGSLRAIRPLIAELRSPNFHVREAAAELLGECNDLEAVVALGRLQNIMKVFPMSQNIEIT